MNDHHFNQQLYSLRLCKGLSRKEVAKATGIPRFVLHLYEDGFHRPGKRSRAKLESFYGVALNFEGDRDYPGPIEREVVEDPPFRRRRRTLFAGILSTVMATVFALGTLLFLRSTKNDFSFYGETYTQLYRAATEKGEVGTELVTGAPYHYLNSSMDTSGSILFYDKSSFLHFNECHYSSTIIFHEQPEIGEVQVDYLFGGDLFSDSHRCFFTFGSVTYGTVISFEVPYYGEPVTKLENKKVHVEGQKGFEDETLLMIFNWDITFVVRVFEVILEENLGREVSFVNTFLSDREMGRNVALVTQITGLALIFVGLLGLFYGFSLLFYSLLKRLHLPQAKVIGKGKARELPKDFHAPLAIPGLFIRLVSRTLAFIAMALLLVSLLGRVGVGLPPLFYNPGFLFALKITFRINPFIWVILVCRTTDDGAALLTRAVKSFLFFLFLAASESALIAVTNAWGYDFSSIINEYVPGSVFQVAAMFFLIHFFLAFTPAFLKGKKAGYRILWRCLSLIPFLFLVLSVALSNAHFLFYDTGKNIFISFWFPSSLLPGIIATTFILFGSFFLRVFFRHRYGANTPIYRNGDRYAFYTNIVTVLSFLLVYLLILVLRRNEYAYYLGLVDGAWILILVPIFLFCKTRTMGISKNNE